MSEADLGWIKNLSLEQRIAEVKRAAARREWQVADDGVFDDYAVLTDGMRFWKSDYALNESGEIVFLGQIRMVHTRQKWEIDDAV